MKLAVVVLSMAGIFSVSNATSTTRAEDMAVKCKGTAKGIHFYRNATWHLQDRLNRHHTRASTVQFHSCDYGVWVAKLWHSRSRKLYVTLKKVEAHKRDVAKAQQSQGVLTSDWVCIHRYEGSWTANTGNGYYGGLQMDYSFMSAYGPEFMRRWGTADRWPVYAQVIAANRAKASRGYSPWPNTARSCGLL